MSQGAPHPRMHGYTHVPGGADPIPAGAPDFEPFYDAIQTLAATRDLRGYWRLGEGGFGPYADSKPASSWANVPMLRVNNTIDMTDIDPGALPPEDDDGAVQFNSATGGGSSDYLEASNTWGTGGTNPFEIGMTGKTVMGWVKPFASASAFEGSILSMIHNSGSLGGYALGVTWPARTIYWRGDSKLTGPVLTADEWVFACGVHDATSARLYLNGALVATGSFSSGAAANMKPVIGQVWLDDGSSTRVLYGAVDEVSVWGSALTAAEIAELAAAGGAVVPETIIHLPTATSNFEVWDHNSQVILRVTASGPTYHIKSGKSWVADL